MATLLPFPELQFFDNNGLPLAGGTINTYVPGTTTPKQTWQDANASILNTNPIVLDAAGRCIVYGTGSYRFIVKDALGNQIYDKITTDTSSPVVSNGGTSGGSANAQTVTAANFNSTDGQIIIFKAGFTNTSALSVNPNVSGPINVLKDTTSGPVSLVGGEVTQNNEVAVVYDAGAGAFHILNPAPLPIKVTTYASGTGTHTPSNGTRQMRVRLRGGGGGGGGVAATGAGENAVAGAGGEGGYVEHFYTTVSGTYSYGVGAGGSAAGTGNASGGTGGNTTFGALTASGGGGGGGGATGSTSAAQAGAGGGAASGGNLLNLPGQSGHMGIRNIGGSASGNGGGTTGGTGVSTNGVGNAGTNGGGASGSVNSASQSGRAGAAGGAGWIVVEEFQ